MNQFHADQPNPPLRPSGQLQAAIVEDSNHLLDWMWYTDQMESDAERRYCLQRALYINPNDREALNALQVLNRQETRLKVNASPMPLSWLSRLLANVSL